MNKCKGLTKYVVFIKDMYNGTYYILRNASSIKNNEDMNEISIQPLTPFFLLSCLGVNKKVMKKRDHYSLPLALCWPLAFDEQCILLAT